MVLKKRMYLYWALLVLALLTMLMLRLFISDRTSEARDYEAIREEGILRLVIDYNPLSYYWAGDTIVGFDYELAQLLSKESGLEVQLFPELSLDKSYEGLNNGTYDVIARLTPVTSLNLQHYNFTQPLLLNKQVLVQRNGDEQRPSKLIRNQLELAEDTVYLVDDAATRLRINNLSHEIGDTIYTKIEHQYGAEQLIMMVARGDIDYVVCDESIALRMKEEYPYLDTDTDISFTQFLSWALRKGSPVLLDSLNQWLDRVKTTPEFKRIVKQYYKRRPIKESSLADTLFVGE